MFKTVAIIAVALVCWTCRAQEAAQTGRFSTVKIDQHLIQVDSLTGRCWLLVFEDGGPIFKPITYSGVDGNLRLMPEAMNEIAVLEDKLVRRQDELKAKQEVLKKMLEKKKQEEAASSPDKSPSPAAAKTDEGKPAVQEKK